MRPGFRSFFGTVLAGSDCSVPSYLKAPAVLTLTSGVWTLTVTEPSVPAGVRPVIFVSETTLTLVAEADRI